MNEKDIIYFIMSHSSEDTNGNIKFRFPILPHPDMGQDFINNIKQQFSEVGEWMKQNPDKISIIENGYFLSEWRSL